jgi:phosphatidylglycerophosphate synthase
MSEHVRQHQSVLAGLEKRLLVAIAGRLPLRIHSDHLTGLAMAAMVAAGVGYVLAQWNTRALWLVVAALVVNWFGDSLDGTLARVRKVERPRYGFYLDHVLDIVGITVLLGGLACSPFMTPVIALLLLVSYLLVAGEVFLATAVRGVFKMSFFGVGPTELRILLAIGTIALRDNPQVTLGSLGRMPLFDFGGLIAIAGLGMTLVVSVIHNASALALLEPRRIPAAAPSRHLFLVGSRLRASAVRRSGALRPTAHGSTMPVYSSPGIRASGNSKSEPDVEGKKPPHRSRCADA